MTGKWRGAAVPILPIADLDRSLEFYRGIGFEVERSPLARYGFVRFEALQLHVAETEGFDPFAHAGMAYLYVDDVDAIRATLEIDDAAGLSETLLRSRWKRGESLARMTDLRDEPWGLREFSLLDPDNNLLRIGSPLPSSRSGPVSPPG